MRRVALYSSLIGLVVGCDRVWGLDDLVPPSASSDAGPDAPRPDGEPAGCPASYDQIMQTTASRYRVVVSHASWTAAADDCADDAPGLTHLIVLSNQLEHDALLTIPPTPTMWLYDDTWIGVTDIKTKNQTFRWVTDEVTNYVVPAVVGQPPWEPDQPDSMGTCGELHPSGSLHDETCGSSSNYICECDGRPNDVTVYK